MSDQPYTGSVSICGIQVQNYKMILVSSIYSEETVQDGMVIEDSVGLRLKAMEYWCCAESGVKSKCSDGSTFKFVIGESMRRHGM